MLGSSLIAGAANLISGNKQSQGQREANQTNIQLAREQNQWNLNQWNRENEYNSPSATISRLKNAGLNPASMYANPSSGMVAAASGKPAAAARVENERTGEAQGMARMVETIMNGFLRSQEIQKVQAQTELMRTQADLTSLKQGETLANVGRLEASSRNLDSGTAINQKRLYEIDSRIRNLDANTLLTDAKQHGQEIYNSYAAGLHHTKIEMQQAAKQLTEAQTTALAERIAQAWKQIDIQEGRLAVDSARLDVYTNIARSQITNLSYGSEAKFIENEMKRENLNYRHIHALMSAVRNISGAFIPMINP